MVHACGRRLRYRYTAQSARRASDEQQAQLAVECGNKDAAFIPEVVYDPQRVPSFAILHRPTRSLHFRRHHDGLAVIAPPSGEGLEHPSRVLHRTPSPILEPQTTYERNGLVSDVVFPSATDLRADGALDQKAVLKIGDYLIVLAVAFFALIIGIAFVRHDPLLVTFEFALVLLVAAIPVAMPTVLSVTMGVGAKLLSKKQAIVTRLSSIEELAGVDIFCSDKTGTLTENKLTLGDPFCLGDEPADKLILYAALASRAEDKDTIDLTVIGGVKNDQALKAYQVLHFQPFDPMHKRTEATVKSTDGKQFRVAKGAPQVILQMSRNANDAKSAVDEAVDGFAGRGFRSLGVARADGKDDWQFLAVLPMYDPPRATAKATLASAKQMGVQVKMVTGDQVAIAKESARDLGLGTNILVADTLGDTSKKATDAQTASIEGADGFAQVFPEQKYHIVEVLQQRGHIVGMTGDGVNDAPALKKADCGIAVSGATDAARAAASIVLMTSGLTVIVDAIMESRRIVQRMNSYAIYRVTETLRVLLLMAFAILIFNFYPVTAVMIVILALLSGGAIISIAYDNVIYKKRPEAWNMRLVLEISSVLGVVGVVAAFGLLYLGDRIFDLHRDQLQTLLYLKLSVAGHLTIFLTRTRGGRYARREYSC